MKALVGAFNQEKALVGAFSVIVKTECETDGSFAALICPYFHSTPTLDGVTYGTKTDIQLTLIEPAQLLQNLFQQLKQTALNQYLLKTFNSNF